MNLYKILVKHFSQKDNHQSIETFLLAKDDDAVYQWIDTEKQYGCWSDRDEEDGMLDIYNDEFEVVGQETYKEKIIRLNGEINDEDLELSDLYYGATIYGWEKMPSDMLETRAAVLNGLGVLVEA